MQKSRTASSPRTEKKRGKSDGQENGVPMGRDIH